MNTPPNLELWTVKDVAQLFRVSVDTVRKYEREWGLVRIRTRTASVWYRRCDVIRAYDQLLIRENET